MTPILDPSQTPSAMLIELENLFLDVDQKLADMSAPPSGVNPCAACFSCCCAVHGPSQHRVSEIEFALMEARLGGEVGRDFRRYIGRERTDAGSLVFDCCPNYDLQAHGCGVYPQRPFACRVFGHMKPEGTFFPPGCAFTGRERTFALSAYFRDVPGARELRRLAREFQMFSPPQAAHFVDLEESVQAEPGQDVSNLQPDDPLDRALLQQMEGRFNDALDTLIEARQHDRPSLFLDYSVAMLLTRMEQHEAALVVYGSLLKRLPQRVDLHYYAGFHAYFCQQPELAKSHFLAAVQGLPDHSMALGFLGYMALQEQLWAEAESYFLQALQADERNPFVHLRLGSLYLQTDRHSEARTHLETAARHPATQAQAQAALADQPTLVTVP